MPSPTVIDVEKLLAPIREDQPSGDELSIADIRGPLYLTKDAWDEARKLIKEQADKERNGGIDSQGTPWRVIPEPNWDLVIERTTNLLTSHSKDMRAASWLTEALLRRHHAAGLRDGLQVCLGLCERYWSSIHPAPTEEEGHGATVTQFTSLVNFTPPHSESAPFFAPPILEQLTLVKGRKGKERDDRSYSVADYFRAKYLESKGKPEERKNAIDAGQAQMSDIKAIAALTDPAFYDTLTEDLQSSIDLLRKIGDFFSANCRNGHNEEPTVPMVTPFREEVEKLRDLVKSVRGETAMSESGETSNLGSASMGVDGSSEAVGLSRQSAFQTIERVAQFFERTEPHSPVCFVLRQAIRWGKMPLPELLNELIEDQGTMTDLRKRVGLPNPKPEGSSS